MNKGLEALETIIKSLTYECPITENSELDKAIKTIEAELKKVDELESKLLTEKQSNIVYLKYIERLEEARDMWKGIADNLGEKSDKQDKILRIIREKQVDISSLNCAETVEQYNVKENGFTPLTAEEFKILKEGLCNEN